MIQRSRRSALKLSLSASTAFALAFCGGTVAHAENPRVQERSARKACLTGDYSKGVSILSDLFISTRNPTYLFNQGRCFEQNRKYEDAIVRFEEYLRAAGAGDFKLKAADQEQAQKHIQKCKDLLAEQEARTLPAPQAFVPPVAVVAPQPEVPPPAPVIVQAPPPAPERSGSGLLVGGIVAATLGAGAVGTGVYLNIKANSMRDDMQNNLNGYTSGKESERKTYATLCWVGYGVGAAGLVTGAILIALGARGDSGRPSSNLALLPAVGQGQSGVMLSGGF